jgi:hypothetical protein
VSQVIGKSVPGLLGRRPQPSPALRRRRGEYQPEILEDRRKGNPAGAIDVLRALGFLRTPVSERDVRHTGERDLDAEIERLLGTDIEKLRGADPA